MNYRELIKNYGLDYLKDTSETIYDEVFMMDDLESMLEGWTISEIVSGAANGYHYNPYVDVTKPVDATEPFDITSDYFAIDNGLVSIDKEALVDYMIDKLNVDEEDFMDWCEEQGYTD